MTSKKIDDRLIVPRPCGMCPPAFTVACGDVVPTPLIRYTTLCIFNRGCRVATIAGSPPLYGLFPIPWEQGILTTVHDHDGKRVRTLIFLQILTPDAHGAGSNRRGNMLGAIDKRDGHGNSAAIGMAGEKNPFVIDTFMAFGT